MTLFSVERVGFFLGAANQAGGWIRLSFAQIQADVPRALQRIALVSGSYPALRGGRSNSPWVKSGDHGNSHFLLILDWPRTEAPGAGSF